MQILHSTELLYLSLIILLLILLFLSPVYSGVEGYVRESDGEDEVAELFHSLNGFEDLEPGDLLFDEMQHPVPQLGVIYCTLDLVMLTGIECHWDVPNTLIIATVYNAIFTRKLYFLSIYMIASHLPRTKVVVLDVHNCRLHMSPL